MTAPPSIDLSGWLSEQLEQASPDLLRNMVKTFAEALMGAEADAVCGAGYGAQASLLAGLVRAPTAYDPLVHLDLAVTRQGHVLDRLIATGVLTTTQADTARTAPLGLQSY